MRVKAKRLGYYDLKRRHEGEEFVLTDPKHYSERWMEALDAKVSPQAQRGKKKVAAEESPAAPAAATSPSDLDVI